MNKRRKLTDSGNALRFVDLYREKVKYCSDEGSWYIWNGKFWEKDITNKIINFNEGVTNKIYEEARGIEDSAVKMQFMNHFQKSGSYNSIRDMLSIAKSIPPIPILSGDFDDKIELVNVNNGIIILMTGERIPHDPKKLMSKIIKYDYEPDAQCPKWLSFLDFVLDHDSELIRWIQKCLGLSISGETDRVLPFLYGGGGNGKSTFSETLLKLFGDYAQKTSIDAFSVGSFIQAGDKPNSYLVRLRKARFVIANETTENGKLNVSLIKDITGGDTITGRAMYQSAIEFSPTHTIWMYGNHEPAVEDTTNSIWERIKKIPFDVTIPIDKRRQINEVVDDFLTESAGILAWVVRGYQLYKKEGLKSPPAIENATNQYRQSEDTFQQFIDEKCELNPQSRILKLELLKAYNDYLSVNGEKPDIKMTKLTNELKRKGIYTGGNGGSVYIGIKMTDHTHSEQHISFGVKDIKDLGQINAPVINNLPKNLN